MVWHLNNSKQFSFLLRLLAIEKNLQKFSIVSLTLHGDFELSSTGVVTSSRISSAYNSNEVLIFSRLFPLPLWPRARKLINLFKAAFARTGNSLLPPADTTSRYAIVPLQRRRKGGVSGSGERCKIVCAFGKLPKQQAISETTPLCHRRDINSEANNAGDIRYRSIAYPPFSLPLFDFGIRYANHRAQSLRSIR